MHLPDSVWCMTRASLITFYPVEPLGTHSFLTVDPFKAWVTETGPIYVVALSSVLTVTPLQALEAKRPNRTLLLTPTKKQQEAISHMGVHPGKENLFIDAHLQMLSTTMRERAS